jgi:hypothetical protein
MWNVNVRSHPRAAPLPYARRGRGRTAGMPASIPNLSYNMQYLFMMERIMDNL